MQDQDVSKILAYCQCNNQCHWHVKVNDVHQGSGTKQYYWSRFFLFTLVAIFYFGTFVADSVLLIGAMVWTYGKITIISISMFFLYYLYDSYSFLCYDCLGVF